MQNTDKKIAILILAAGESSRMGKIKQLLPWGDTSLLGNAIHNAQETRATDVLVVLGAFADKIKAEIFIKNFICIENENWRSGIGSSISCGMHYLLKTGKPYDGVLVMLGDQPLIDASYLNEIISAFKSGKKGIVATSYDSRVGVPAIFDTAYFQELTKLHKDFGAKDLIKENAQNVLLLNSRGKEKDIDTIEEYKNLISKISCEE